jgi:tape measure domain-containing protein
MTTPENRVRIVIEADNASGRRGIQETAQDLDSLKAKGQAVDLNGALKLDASAVTQPVTKATQALDAMGTTAKKAGDEAGAAMATAGAEIKKAGSEAEAGGKAGNTAMRNLGGGAAEARAQAEALGANLSDIRALAAQLVPILVAAFGVDQVISFANQVVGAAMAMEQLGATYQAVFKDAAAEQLRYAASMADAFGKSLLDVAGSYKKFAAAADAVGLSTANQQRTFEAVTAALTKVGGSSQDVAGALLALEQMLSKGTVQAEEYRQQFAERIPGALKMGADALGVTTAAFQKMMENGEVVSTEFIPKLATQLERFGDGWQATADTAQANAERLQNSFLELSNSPALTGLVSFIEKIGTAFNKNLTHNIEQVSVTVRSLMAEAKGDLSPFATWTNDLDSLKKQLEALDARKATWIKDLKDQAQGLSEALVNVQTHQVDFGPSGETVDQLRAKLKWFEDQIKELTGKTWVVNVVANVDNSQLVQAKAYIQDLIKGTAEVKARNLENEQYKLDNAVNTLSGRKAAAESKLTDPNLDMREKNDLSREIGSLDTDLQDATIAYRELKKQRDELAKAAPEYARGKLVADTWSKGGHDATDKAYRDYASGVWNLEADFNAGKYGDGPEAVADLKKALDGLWDQYNVKVDAAGKKTASAANAMARFESQGASYLQSAENQVDALAAQLGGDSLAADLAKVDCRYDQLGATIRKAMIGAKGDVADYQAALAKLEEARALEKQIAEIKAWGKAMDTAAATLKELGRLTGDPDLIFGGEKTAIDASSANQIREIEGRYQAEAEAIRKQVEAGGNLDAARADWAENERRRSEELANQETLNSLKTLEAKHSSLAELSGVSQEFWDIQWKLLDENLKRVKDNCDSETAYEAYAAKKRSELRKQEIEARLEYETDFLSTLKDALSLEFGLYKDDATRQRDSWVSLSKEIASGVHDLSSDIAAGATDAFKAWVTGSSSMADAFKDAMNSMLDYLMTIVQKMIAYALENYVIVPVVESFVGSGTSSSGSSLASALTGKGSGSGEQYQFDSAGNLTGILSKSSTLSDSTLSALDASKLTGPGGVFEGKNMTGWVSSGSSTLSTVGSLAGGTLAGAGIGSLFNSGDSMTGTIGGAVGGLAGAGVAAATSLAGTAIGSLLGPIGGAVGGLIGGLLGGSSTKTEVTGSGMRIGVSGDSNTVTGTQYTRTTTSGMFGSSSVSHGITETGPADAETTSAVNDAMSAYTVGIKSAFKALGVSSAEESLSNFSFPSWDVAPGQEEDFYRNVSNAKVGKVLADAGLTDAISAIAKENEYWIDQIDRLGSAMTTVGTTTKQMGLSLESLAGEDYISGLVDKMLAAGDSASSAGMDFEALAGVLDADTLASLKDMQAQAAATGEEVQATNEQLRQLALAQYASEIVEAFGSTDAAQSAFNRYFTNAYSSTEQATRLMQYYAEGAGEAIGALNASGVSLENFWASYRTAMESGPMSADQLKAWDNTAQWVEAWDGSLKNAAQAWDDTNQTVIDGINDQIKALGSQRDAIQNTLDMWSDFLASIKDLRKEIKLDADLSDLSPKEIYEQKKTLFDQTAAKARAGDAKAMAELPDITKDFLQASRDYWASSEQYYADFNHADETLASLENYAQTQVDQAQAQLDALNNEIAILQLQVNQLTLVNTNLGTLGNLVGDGISAVVGAINNSSFSSAYADSIAAANAAQADAAASLLAGLGGSTSSDAGESTGAGFEWSGSTGGLEVDEDGNWQWVGFSEGGLARGGVPGVDSIPAKLMDGERVIDAKHTRILEWLVEGGNTSRVDTAGIERRLDAQMRLDGQGYRALATGLEAQRSATRKLARSVDRLARRAR